MREGTGYEQRADLSELWDDMSEMNSDESAEALRRTAVALVLGEDSMYKRVTREITRSVL